MDEGSVWFPVDEFKYDGKYPLYQWQNFVTPQPIGDLETKLAKNIIRLCRVKRICNVNIAPVIAEFEKINHCELHSEQKNAVLMAANTNLMILTGGPGTGKTTTLKAIAFVLRRIRPRLQIRYLAPTGKAARRITESTGEYATTVDSYLQIIPNQKQDVSAKFDEVNFTDESSMLDMSSAAQLTSAISGQLILVGDTEQLPSVGPGSVLRDLILSGIIPVVRLTKTFRQDDTSVFYDAIQRIRDGIAQLPQGDDFHPIKIKDNKALLKKILSLYSDVVNKYGIENVAVLLPYRKHGFCVDELNPYLKRIIFGNNAKEEYQVGDYVMQLENRRECSNGDTGIITQIKDGYVEVKYAMASVKYTELELDQITLCYANTVHKSQGSEYDCVILVLLNKHKAMLNKNIVYTGVTRGKKEAYVLYEEEALNIALKTEADAERITMLAEKLRCIA